MSAWLGSGRLALGFVERTRRETVLGSLALI
jgi:hypothetical protein